jgi:type IV secretory pathway TraG/TraD family ATPase VirD4
MTTPSTYTTSWDRTADEIALWFARETNLQIVFLAGLRPLALRRTDYDRDPAFAGMVSGLQRNPQPQPQPQQQRSAA